MSFPFKKNISSFLGTGHERSIKIKKNIVYTFLIKGLSILIGFMLVPLAMNYVNAVQYGIWLTIISIVTWINTFDIGLSNGLRNKLAYSLAVNDKKNIATYISTTYALLVLIALVTFLIFYAIGSYFNWNQLLNLEKSVTFNVWPILVTTLGFFCIQFILQPINSILNATHQSFKTSLLVLLGQSLTLIAIYVLIHTTQGNLLVLVAVTAGAPIIVLFLAHIFLFSSSLKEHAPSFKKVNFKTGRGLFSIGGAFFMIQIGALILYETDNIIITKLIGPINVTSFNIAYKYFSILTIAFSIIITPYWSAFTDAYANNDFEWIRSAIKKMRLLWLAFAALAFLLYIFSGIFYKFWIGNTVTVPHALTFSIAIYTVLQIYTDIHAYLLNGIGKLRIQLILVIGTGIINIPLSVILVRKIGLHGTVVANIIVLIIINVFFTYQTRLIINKKASGIWNR